MRILFLHCALKHHAPHIATGRCLRDAFVTVKNCIATFVMLVAVFSTVKTVGCTCFFLKRLRNIPREHRERAWFGGGGSDERRCRKIAQFYRTLHGEHFLAKITIEFFL